MFNDTFIVSGNTAFNAMAITLHHIFFTTVPCKQLLSKFFFIINWCKRVLFLKKY